LKTAIAFEALKRSLWIGDLTDASLHAKALLRVLHEAIGENNQPLCCTIEVSGYFIGWFYNK